MREWDCKGKQRGKEVVKKLKRTSEKERRKWQEVKKRSEGRNVREERDEQGNEKERERESAGGLIFNVINEL